MSSRSLAAARARRGGEQVPPISGNRPVTSIGSQAAFAQHPQQMYQQPMNVRTGRAMQPQPQQNNRPSSRQIYEQHQQQQQMNNLPFQKLSISDAIGLITLRLGRVEQWIIETDQDETKSNTQVESQSIPDNHKIIDISVMTSIINRLDSLEKNKTPDASPELNSLTEEVKVLSEQFKRMADDVNKHTIELAKCSEQVLRFNRELVETKDILKTFMVKYDMFAQETTQNFSDYETALGDLEKRLPVEIASANVAVEEESESSESSESSEEQEIE